MPVSTPFYLLLTGLAAGVAACLAFLPARQTGRGFARTMALVGLGAWAAALAYDLWFRMGPQPRPGLDGTLGGVAVACQMLAALLMAVYAWRLSGEPLPGRGLPAASGLVAGTGVLLAAALVLQGSPGAGDGRAALLILAAVQGLAGALLLGSVLTAMLLGHFYLVVPGLSLSPLRRLCVAFIVIVALQGLLDVTVIGLLGWESVWPATISGPDPTGTLLLGVMPLFIRLLFGLAGPLILGVMAARCAWMGSTQSATGILYAAVVFALIGGFAAGHLLVSTGVPL